MELWDVSRGGGDGWGDKDANQQDTVEGSLTYEWRRRTRFNFSSTEVMAEIRSKRRGEREGRKKEKCRAFTQPLFPSTLKILRKQRGNLTHLILLRIEGGRVISRH